MKEYWNRAAALRKRIKRKIHEIHILRQQAEGMNGNVTNDMPKTVSPSHNRMEAAVFKIMTLEQEIKEAQLTYDALLADMEERIKAVEDADYRDLLSKRYLEFKPWAEIMSEMGYSKSNIFRLHSAAVDDLKSRDIAGLANT